MNYWFKKSSIWPSCQQGKSCRLPFFVNQNTNNLPLQKVHCDLWGPSLVTSVQNFRYYVAFIDDFSRFTWSYPFPKDFDFYSRFFKFQRVVEIKFHHELRFFSWMEGESLLNNFIKHLKNVACCINYLLQKHQNKMA